jgi:hypothetical protein
MFPDLASALPAAVGTELFAATLVIGLLLAVRRTVTRTKPRTLS